MLRVRECATHMGGFCGPKFSEQGSLFGRFSMNTVGISRNWQKLSKMSSFHQNSS